MIEPTQRAAMREHIWQEVIKVLAGIKDMNSKACIVQNAIAEFGPVPNSMGDAVRKAMMGCSQ